MVILSILIIYRWRTRFLGISWPKRVLQLAPTVPVRRRFSVHKIVLPVAGNAVKAFIRINRSPLAGKDGKRRINPVSLCLREVVLQELTVGRKEGCCADGGRHV